MFSLICALYKRFSKHSWGWWFEMQSRSLWRHCNANLGMSNVTCSGPKSEVRRVKMWYISQNLTLLHWCVITEALKGHRVVWKIEICYLIRMTYEWKPMSSGWHNNIVVTHPDEIPISAKSPGWHTVYDMSSGWHTAVSKSHPDEIRPGANSSGWLRVQMTLCHPDDIGEYRKSSGWHPTMLISHPDVIPPIVKSSGWDTANS